MTPPSALGRILMALRFACLVSFLFMYLVFRFAAQRLMSEKEKQLERQRNEAEAKLKESQSQRVELEENVSKLMREVENLKMEARSNDGEYL